MKVVENFNAKNQYVIEEGSNLIFQSYDSIIARYNQATYELTLYSDFDYSKTTSKYLHQFLENYVGFGVFEYIKKWNIKEISKDLYTIIYKDIQIKYEEI